MLPYQMMPQMLLAMTGVSGDGRKSALGKVMKVSESGFMVKDGSHRSMLVVEAVCGFYEEGFTALSLMTTTI